MKEVEGLLKEHWFLSREIKRLRLDLSLAQAAYERSAVDIPTSCRYDVVRERNRKIARPVEINAMIIVDEYRAQLESIEGLLNKAKEKLERIEEYVDNAGLSAREDEYIRLRYFKKISAEGTAQRMYMSPSTCRRIKKTAFEKLMDAGKGDV